MTRYLYAGPATGFELDGEEYLVYPEQTLDLPPEHRLTQSFLAQGYLVELPLASPPPAAPRKEAAPTKPKGA